MKRTLFIVPTVLLICAPSAFADEVFADDVIAQGNLCVGEDCANLEQFVGNSDPQIKIKGADPWLVFDDNSALNSFSDNDWRIQANTGGRDVFLFTDATAGTTPFSIEGGAPESALVVTDNGDIGLGTILPGNNLGIVNEGSASIGLEATGGDADFSIRANTKGFFLRDEDANTTPWRIENAAPDFSLFVQDDGSIGLGTDEPGAPLELSSEDTFNFFRITATGAAVNDSVDITFTSGPLGTGQLRYNIVDGDTQEMSLDADGNMVLDGTLTTTGPTCSGGCDRVFEAAYDLPSIKDHASAMYAAGHLPTVGPTLPGQPVNVTEKMGQMLNALEHAHIFIAQQEETISDLNRNLATTQGDQLSLTQRVIELEATILDLQRINQLQVDD